MNVVPAGATLRLSVPAGPEQISTVRSFAFAIARHQGWGQETTEDLKLALSEVAADGIEGGGSAILVSAVEHPDRVEVSVEVTGAGSRASDPAIDRAQIVRALFPGVRIERRPDAVVTMFSVERG